MTSQMIELNNGSKRWVLDGKPHREDGPAYTKIDGSYSWFLNGNLHREDGPAYNMYGSKKWYINGKLHREDGPAIEYDDGSKTWYINGKLHREDGPAVITINDIDSYNLWYENGKLHRFDGPAIEHNNGNKEWYIDGVKFNKCNFDKVLSLTKRFINNLKRKYQVKVKNTIYDNTNICKNVCDLISKYVI